MARATYGLPHDEGDSIHLWRTPVMMLKNSLRPVSVFTQQLEFRCKFLKMSTVHSGIPYNLAIFHSDCLCTLSNVFSKSMKFIDIGCWNSTQCSIMLRNVKKCSLHDRPRRKPACSWRNVSSTASRSRFNIIRQKTLPGTDIRVIPRNR